MSKKIKTKDITKDQGDALKAILGWLVDIFVDKDEKSGEKKS